MNIIKYFGICLFTYLPLSALADQTVSIASERELRMGGAIENALEMRLFACIAELNNRRNQQLIDLMSSMP